MSAVYVSLHRTKCSSLFYFISLDQLGSCSSLLAREKCLFNTSTSLPRYSSRRARLTSIQTTCLSIITANHRNTSLTWCCLIRSVMFDSLYTLDASSWSTWLRYMITLCHVTSHNDYAGLGSAPLFMPLKFGTSFGVECLRIVTYFVLADVVTTHSYSFCVHPRRCNICLFIGHKHRGEYVFQK